VHLFCNTSTSETYQYNDCVAAQGTEKEYELEGINSKLPGGVSFHGLNGQILADWIIGNWVNIED
jgi:ABC-type glucose/galactose transport system permease subunit